MTHRKKLSVISSLHYLRLIYRSVIFLLAVTAYLSRRSLFGSRLAALIWGVYTAEMIARFFPSKTESMGCQKQFRKNHIPTGQKAPVLPSPAGTFAVAAVWLLLNGMFGLLYLAGTVDRGFMMLLSLFYGVCDMICILFFCPFQTWFMKNRCCTVCRIYNWDFAMMFTPCLFIPSLFTWSLLAMSLALLLRWEITLRRHPERFSERTNAALSCANCQEKLCQHKKQLRTFWEKERVRLWPQPVSSSDRSEQGHLS